MRIFPIFPGIPNTYYWAVAGGHDLTGNIFCLHPATSISTEAGHYQIEKAIVGDHIKSAHVRRYNNETTIFQATAPL
jgi:hypothetical protein